VLFRRGLQAPYGEWIVLRFLFVIQHATDLFDGDLLEGANSVDALVSRKGRGVAAFFVGVRHFRLFARMSAARKELYGEEKDRSA
jgi:hypothetical protein